MVRLVTEKVHNIKTLKENRKALRNCLTPAEANLWSFLKNSQLENRKFRRQHSVGPYVLDFYCPSEKLCVELDGAAHFTDYGYEYDTARTDIWKLSTFVCSVLRIRMYVKIRKEFWKK